VRQADPERRKRLIGRYQNLADGIESILFRRDPIGIGSTIDNPNDDEYAPEAESIARSLPDIIDREALQFTIWQVFIRFFTEEVAGPEARYKPLADEIWLFADEVAK
jgi:hypothetical protein